MNDYCIMWRLDHKGNPVWTSICVARALVRYFKGHGKKIGWDKNTMHYYRKRKLTVTDAFRILKPFYKPKVALADHEGVDEHGKLRKFSAVCKKLKDCGLLPSGSEASKLWKQKVKHLEKVCPGKVDFERELSVDDIEEWSHNKKDSVKDMRQAIVDRAPQRGWLEADQASEVHCAPELMAFETPMILVSEEDNLTPNVPTQWPEFTT